MNYINFTSWLKNNTEVLNESTVYTITKNVWNKLPYDSILKQFFTDFEPSNEISVENGLFWKKDNSLNVLYGSKCYDFIKSNKKQIFTLVGNDLLIEIDYKTYKLHISRGTVDYQRGKSINFFDNDFTGWQEAITAVLLNLNVHGNKEELKNIFNIDGCSFLKRTGICKYLDFDHVNTAGFDKNEIDKMFIEEFNHYFANWLKHFEIIKTADIKSIIDNVISGINWNNFNFAHPKMKLSSQLKTTLKQYLSANRMKQNKNVYDKSDIILYSSESAAIKAMHRMLNQNDMKSLFDVANKYFNWKQVIGVSLKKINNSIHCNLADSNSTCFGTNINTNKVLYVNFSNTNSNQNTFYYNEALQRNPSDKTAYLILSLTDAGKKHIHTNADEVMLTVRTAGTSNLVCEFRIKGEPAFGKCNSALSIEIKDILKNPMELKTKLNLITEKLREMFKTNPVEIHNLFASASGYPFVKNINNERTTNQTNVPYLKIS